MQSSRRQILEDTFVGASPREVGGRQPPPAAVGRHANPARGGDDGWRAARTLVALGLIAVGLLLVIGAAWALAARALPFAWLPGRLPAQSGTVLVLAGVVLGATRGRSGR